MKPSRHLMLGSCFALCFLSGWILRGIFDWTPVSNEQLISSNAKSDESIMQKNNLPFIESLFEPNAEGGIQDRSVVTAPIAREGERQGDSPFVADSQRADSQSQINDIVRYIQQRQFQAAYALLINLRQSDAEISAIEIEQISSNFYDQVIQIGLDNFITSDLLLSLSEEVVELSVYSPHAQFFQIVMMTDENHELALSDLDALSSYFQEQITERQLQLLENWILERVEHDLFARQDWASLNQWYALLISRAPDPSDIYRKQATLQYQQGRFIESLESLELAGRSSVWSVEDEQLYNSNRAGIEQQNVSFIQLQRHGEHYVASLKLNNRIEVKLLMDTGASLSALDYRFVQSTGINNSGSRIRLSTASGQVEADLLDIHSVQFGEYRLSNLEFASIDLGRNQGLYHGLLGMDILGEFEFYLDQREAILYLSSGNDLSQNVFGF